MFTVGRERSFIYTLRNATNNMKVMYFIVRSKKLFILMMAMALFFAVSMPKSSTAQQSSAEPPIVANVASADQDEYLEPDIHMLSRLYWAIGKFDFNDVEAIDNYLLINECDIYRQFVNNDFEWNRIREATVRFLREGASEFPTKFDFVTQINLERYDVNNALFHIDEESAIENLTRIDLSIRAAHTLRICGKSGEISGYPANVIVILSRPFNLEKFAVAPELAQMYLDESRQQFSDLPQNLQVSRYERVAYLRLKLNIMQYRNTTRIRGSGERAVVFAQLDGFEIYADPEMMKPLYAENVRDQRFRRLSGRESGQQENGRKRSPEESN